jgi:two-component system, LuxR family, sensor kinase FixL
MTPVGPASRAGPAVPLGSRHLPWPMTPMNDSLHVLVVDDDAGTRANLRDILEMDGFRVEAAATAAEALDRSDWSRYAAVILDRRLPDGSAEELLPHLKRLAPDAAVLIVTGYADLEGAIAALQQGAADYILKPINPDALRASLLRVADRRRLAQAKERSEAAFRTLVEAAPCLIVILRPDHTIAYFSRFAEELTGRPAAEVPGRDFFATFLPERTHTGAADCLRSALAGKAARGVEAPVLCKDGSRRSMIWNAQLLPDYEGGPAVLAVGQDITALKQAQERTLQAERLAAIGQMVAGLAHESGNALARSQACLEMLGLEVRDRPEALELVGRVQKAQDHLQQLYDEVRNYAAPLKLEREPWPVDAVWRQAWANLAVRRQGRQATLREECGGAGLRCAIDPFRLEQVFRNILDNALAACADPVAVTITCADASLEGRPALRVAVRDNGPGLTAEQRQRIFEPFYTTKTKGTGLGMAIAQRIVDAHGGHIAVGGNSGAGAEILITLPREVR